MGYLIKKIINKVISIFLVGLLVSNGVLAMDPEINKEALLACFTGAEKKKAETSDGVTSSSDESGAEKKKAETSRSMTFSSDESVDGIVPICYHQPGGTSCPRETRDIYVWNLTGIVEAGPNSIFSSINDLMSTACANVEKDVAGATISQGMGVVKKETEAAAKAKALKECTECGNKALERALGVLGTRTKFKKDTGLYAIEKGEKAPEKSFIGLVLKNFQIDFKKLQGVAVITKKLFKIKNTKQFLDVLKGSVQSCRLYQNKENSNAFDFITMLYGVSLVAQGVARGVEDARNLYDTKVIIDTFLELIDKQKFLNSNILIVAKDNTDLSWFHPCKRGKAPFIGFARYEPLYLVNAPLFKKEFVRMQSKPPWADSFLKKIVVVKENLAKQLGMTVEALEKLLANLQQAKKGPKPEKDSTGSSQVDKKPEEPSTESSQSVSYGIKNGDTLIIVGKGRIIDYIDSADTDWLDSARKISRVEVVVNIQKPSSTSEPEPEPAPSSTSV